jgi:predicted dehydrogenase
MPDRICRWGILGTANIARKNWQAIRLAENATLTAVASRNAERARQFIDECQGHVPFPSPPKPLGSYDELLRAADIDAIYLPLPTGVRTEWAIRAAEAKKHVLVEKPVGAAAAEVEAILAACRKNRVQFMDGVMFMHSARLTKLREIIDDGESVGEIRRITAQFTFRGGEDFLAQNIRANHELEPLGCLGDLGWYTIRFSLWAMKYQMPVFVTGRLIQEAKRLPKGNGAPTEFAMELVFPNGATAANYCSFLAENSQFATISGTKGYAHLRDFVLPFCGSHVDFTVTNAAHRHAGCDFLAEDWTRTIAVAEYATGQATAQEVNMIRNFSNLVLSGSPDESWGEIALKTQRVVDACLQSARQNGQPVEV